MTSSKETRWRQRFDNLERAFGLLAEAVGRQSLSDLEAEGMIQRFEYTFELAWKTAKDYLESQGVSVAYPREVIKAAVQSELIRSQGDIWMEMLERRDEAAHTYDRERFESICSAIRTRFLPAIAGLVDRLRQDSGRFGLGPSQMAEITAVIASDDRVERAVIFGSRAMGTHKPGSDVDICLSGREMDPEAVVELARRLNNETTTAFVIDVLGYSAIDSPSLRHHIDQEGVVIYHRDGSADSQRVPDAPRSL
jgi:nucleotidyltransferase substrate binding protein (TIGR01987 family)